jgi:hypothetical protein
MIRKVFIITEGIPKEGEEQLVIEFSGAESHGLPELIEYIKDTAGIGHSFNVVVDPDMVEYRKEFFFDGDGPFRINSITRKARQE